MKRSIAMLLVFVLLAAMFPAVSAVQVPDGAMVLKDMDPAALCDVAQLQQIAWYDRDAELNAESITGDIIMPKFEMYGMTVLTGETMKVNCNLKRCTSESSALVMVFKGHYTELTEASEVVAAGALPDSAGGGYSMEWDTAGCEAGDYTVCYAIVSKEEEILFASMADVYLSDMEIPLERLGLYVMELGMEADVMYRPAYNHEMMTVHPVRYPYHTTDRRYVRITGKETSSVGNFYGEDGFGVGAAPGTYTLRAYIEENGKQAFLTELQVIVEEMNENHPQILPESGYLNVCHGMDFPIEVKIPAGKTMEDALVQVSRPDLLELKVENNTLYIKTKAKITGLYHLIISFDTYFDVKGFYIKDHFYVDEWIDPTCTEDGMRVKVCRQCGDEQFVETLPATGHATQGKTIVTHPTATKDGLSVSNCIHCGIAIEKVLPRIFTDTQPDWFYSDALDYCYEEGIINGLTANTFGPGETLNRAQLVTMLYRHAGSPEVEGENRFTDVPEGQFYTNAVIWASANGIVNGYEDSSFRPGNPINRQELVTMLHRYAVSLGKDNGQRSDLSAFTDLDQLMGYAADAMQWAVANGIINGISETELGPRQSANRAQTVTILYRTITGILAE